MASLESLNSCFHDVVTDKNRPNFLDLPHGPYPAGAMVEFEEVTEEEVLQLLSTLDATKATGSDQIPTSLLKASAKEICPSLTQLVNTILISGELPEQFKYAHITPVLKKGNPNTASNYRPISLLPVLSKLIEKIVCRQLSRYIESAPEGDILPNEQFAYRPNHSTEDALTIAIDHWCRSVDDGQYVGICFVDMSKAFDRVNHELLLAELHNCGIGGVVLQWFRNYLDNRKQAVKVGVDLSSPVSCTRGVPQGSVLGPVLYSIYVRLVPRVLKNVTTIQYADDICFFLSGKEISGISATLSDSLHDLNTFLEEKSLLLNASKTQIMLVSSPRSTPPPLTIKLGDQTINQVESAKYLGLQIDQHLSFSEHVHRVVSKVAGLTSALRRNRRMLDMRSRRMFYLAMIQPHLEYSSNAFVNHLSSELLSMLQVAANNAVRAMFGLPDWCHVSPLYAKLSIAPLQLRFMLKCYIAAYKCAHKLAPSLLTNRLALNSRESSHTRQISFQTFKLPQVRSKLGLQSFSFTAADRFNCLPAAIRCADSLPIFIAATKNFIGFPRREG